MQINRVRMVNGRRRHSRPDPPEHAAPETGLSNTAGEAVVRCPAVRSVMLPQLTPA
jgi:hypothetical protein